jgi:hypothetical protein
MLNSNTNGWHIEVHRYCKYQNNTHKVEVDISNEHHTSSPILKRDKQVPKRAYDHKLQDHTMILNQQMSTNPSWGPRLCDQHMQVHINLGVLDEILQIRKHGRVRFTVEN